jgi:IS5 family transposase
VWAFRESLKKRKLAEVLFDRLNQALAEMGIELKSGQIIDATFDPVPIQRDGRDNNALIKGGAVPYSGDKTLISPTNWPTKTCLKKAGKAITATRTTSTKTLNSFILPIHITLGSGG